jgi:hypothetical protein
MSSIVTVAGLTKLADVLEKPEVVEWISKPSVGEMKELNRLPVEQRKAVAQGLGRVVAMARKKKMKVNPWLVAFASSRGGTLGQNARNAGVTQPKWAESEENFEPGLPPASASAQPHETQP